MTKEELEVMRQKIIDEILPQVRDMDGAILGEWNTCDDVAGQLEIILGLKQKPDYDDPNYWESL
jgi:hypothetical protein